MSTVNALADWVHGLRPSDVPADVRTRAREQLLAAAGAVRAVAQADGRDAVWGTALPMGARGPSGSANQPDVAARAPVWAGLAARHAWDDPVLAGRVGLGAPQAIAAAGVEAGADLERLVTAMVLANEVGGRVGLALLVGPRGTHTDSFAAAAGGAAAVAWLRGAGPTGIAGALAAALADARRFTLDDLARDPEAPGATAAAAALLDAASPFWAPLTPRPLFGALRGLGRAWLTRTLIVRAHPGLPFGAVAVEAVGEILRRHVKAADKRLRADQIERIELRVGLQAWGMDAAASALPPDSPAALAASIRRAVGVLVARHTLTPADLTPAALAEKHAEIAAVAERVEVVHDWGLTVAGHTRLARALGPLLGGVSALRDARALDAWPAFGAQDVASLVRARPDRLLRALRTRWFAPPDPADLDAVDLGAFQWHTPVEIKLYTTRGGWWPERRAVPVGTAPADGASDGRAALALARFEDAARPAAEAALAAPASTPAREWLEGLLG